jgi:hypothetical protein
MKGKKPEGKANSSKTPGKGSFEDLAKRGTFIPDKGGPKEGKMPGGPIAGTIVGSDPTIKPEKIIFCPAGGGKSISPSEAGGIEKAKALFQDTGLEFPWIPEELASRLRELSEWVYSTRSFRMSPYCIDAFYKEAECGVVDDYVVLAHAGYGCNCWALQYFIVYGPLYLFLQIGWGGVYMDPARAKKDINSCFGLADKIMHSIAEAIHSPESSLLYRRFMNPMIEIKIFGSDFYGSRWSATGREEDKNNSNVKRRKSAIDVLSEVWKWLNKRQGSDFSKTQIVTPDETLTIDSILEACDPHTRSIYKYLIKAWKRRGNIIQRGIGSIRLKASINAWPVSLAFLNSNRIKNPATIHLIWDSFRRSKTFSGTTLKAYQKEVTGLGELLITKNYAIITVNKDFSLKKAEKLIQAMAKLAESKKK